MAQRDGGAVRFDVASLTAGHSWGKLGADAWAARPVSAFRVSGAFRHPVTGAGATIKGAADVAADAWRFFVLRSSQPLVPACHSCRPSAGSWSCPPVPRGRTGRGCQDYTRPPRLRSCPCRPAPAVPRPACWPVGLRDSRQAGLRRNPILPLPLAPDGRLARGKGLRLPGLGCGIGPWGGAVPRSFRRRAALPPVAACGACPRGRQDHAPRSSCACLSSFALLHSACLPAACGVRGKGWRICWARRGSVPTRLRLGLGLSATLSADLSVDGKLRGSWAMPGESAWAIAAVPDARSPGTEARPCARPACILHRCICRRFRRGNPLQRHRRPRPSAISQRMLPLSPAADSQAPT